MPNLNASDYTTFIKLQAASLAYQNGKIPVPIQRVSQPVPTQSILNAQLLASQAAYLLTPATTTVTTQPATVSSARSDIITGAQGFTTYITYTTDVYHGLSVGSVISITGLTVGPTGVNITSLPVAATPAPTNTTFSVLVSTNTGSSSATRGTITNKVYYTTNVAHNLTSGMKNVTITGVTGFNQTLATIDLVPSSTVFSITSAAGTAVSGLAGVITFTSYYNTGTSVTNVTRVRPFGGRGYVNNPEALSTVSGSAFGSSKFQQVGGLPQTAAKGSGAYDPPKHLARVDTNATGNYKAPGTRTF